MIWCNLTNSGLVPALSWLLHMLYMSNISDWSCKNLCTSEDNAKMCINQLVWSILVYKTKAIAPHDIDNVNRSFISFTKKLILIHNVNVGNNIHIKMSNYNHNTLQCIIMFICHMLYFELIVVLLYCVT